MKQFQVRPDQPYQRSTGDTAQAASFAAPQPSPAAGPAPAQVQPAQSWERVATRYDDTPPRRVSEELPQPEPENTTFDATTRMNGLRNLIFSLGTKNPNWPAEESDFVAEVQPPFDKEQLHQMQHQPAHVATYTERNYTPASEPSSRHESTPTSRLVTAQPEFLPPKPAVEIHGEDQEWNNPAKGHRDRRDAYDDVEILPSWRGQYRKKG